MEILRTILKDFTYFCMGVGATCGKLCVCVCVSIIHCPPPWFHLSGTYITYCSPKKWYKQTSN